MIELLCYSLSAFGLAFIIGSSKISLPTRVALDQPGLGVRARRWLLLLLECPACLGFWEGFAFGALLDPVWFPLHWSLLSLFTCASNLVLVKVSGLDDYD